MKNLLTTKQGLELTKLGFININYRAHGQITGKGAVLPMYYKDNKGVNGFIDLMEIEPMNYQHLNIDYTITVKLIGSTFDKQTYFEVTSKQVLNKVNEILILYPELMERHKTSMNKPISVIS